MLDDWQLFPSPCCCRQTRSRRSCAISSCVSWWWEQRTSSSSGGNQWRCVGVEKGQTHSQGLVWHFFSFPLWFDQVSLHKTLKDLDWLELLNIPVTKNDGWYLIFEPEMYCMFYHEMNEYIGNAQKQGIVQYEVGLMKALGQVIQSKRTDTHWPLFPFLLWITC